MQEKLNQQALEMRFEQLRKAQNKLKNIQVRKEQLEQLKSMLTTHQLNFVTALTEDLGKTAAEAWVSEIGFLIKDINYHLKHITKWCKPKRVSNPLLLQPAKSYIVPEPLGVVLVIGAWNYPLQLSLGPLIAAIAAGNPVILKPSELAPATSAALAKFIPQFLDVHFVQVLEGDHLLVQQLLELPLNHVLYTGGSRAARAIMAQAAKNLIPVTLELGGKSPVIVSQTAPLKQTARRIIWGKFMNAGQTCIAPDYLLVEDSIYEPLVQELQQAIIEFYSEFPEKSQDYGRIISQQHHQRLLGYLEEAKQANARIIDRYQLNDSPQAAGANEKYLAPTLVLNCPNDCKLMQEEIFGPILPIQSVPSVYAAIDIIKQRPSPLACYLFSKNKQEQLSVEQQIQAGTLCINDTLSFMLNPNLPFGGVGESGMGAYHGFRGFKQFSHFKPVVKRSFLFDHPLRYPPYTALKQKFSRWFLR